jgi:hypothetical protein
MNRFLPGSPSDDTVKNMIKTLATFWTSLAFAGIVFAQTKPATPVPPGTPAMEMKTEMSQASVLTGKVISVDPKAGKVTIKTKDREIKLTTDSKSTRAALEQLKVGDTAKVFEKRGKVIAASPVKADSKTKAAD